MFTIRRILELCRPFKFISSVGRRCRSAAPLRRVHALTLDTGYKSKGLQFLFKMSRVLISGHRSSPGESTQAPDPPTPPPPSWKKKIDHLASVLSGASGESAHHRRLSVPSPLLVLSRIFLLFFLHLSWQRLRVSYVFVSSTGTFVGQ